MKAIDACPKAFAICWKEWETATMMCTNDNVVEVELNVVQMLIVMWEMHQSDWEKL